MAQFVYLMCRTLRADLTSEYICHILNHMHAHGKSIVTPTLRQQDADMQARCSLCSLLTQQRVATSQPLRRPSRGSTSYQAGSYSVLLLISFLRCFLKPRTLLKSSGMCFGAISLNCFLSTFADTSNVQFTPDQSRWVGNVARDNRYVLF